MTAAAPLRLGAEFAEATRDQWLGLVDKVLKGKPFERVLVSRTYDGIEVQPLYGRDAVVSVDEYPGQPLHTRGRTAAGHLGGAWDIRQTHAHPDPRTANRQILEDLEGGVTSLHLRLDVAGRGELDGIVVASGDDLGVALDGVLADLAPISLEAGSSFAVAAEWFGEWCEHRGVGPEQVAGSLGADPLGVLARSGTLPQGLDAALGELVELARRCSTGHPRLSAVSIDTGAYCDAGASEGQELAIVLATAAAYLRAMVDGGIDAGAAAAQIDVVLSADTDVFTTIAKQRAMRRCWAHLVEAATGSSDGAGRALRLGVRSADRMMSRRDPWVNMLRTTAACFAAGVGGADSVTVQPFDAALGLPGDLGRRLARNTQLLLQEESHIGRVIDPAGGSWYLESLTDSLCDVAWLGFQRIEAGGGLAAGLADGTVASTIAEVHTARAANIARRRDALTGVSEFPNLAEEQLATERVDRDAQCEAARTRAVDVVEPAGPATTVEPLPVHRLAEAFEALRDASDRVLADGGARPAVFVAGIGTPAEHTARVTFARNLFEAGGIDAPAGEGFEGADDAAAAFAASGRAIAVICSSDPVYERCATDVAAALRGAGATRVYLAGNAGEHREAWSAAGVDEFVHIGVDVVDVLRRAYDALGLGAALAAADRQGVAS